MLLFHLVNYDLRQLAIVFDVREKQHSASKKEKKTQYFQYVSKSRLPF